MKREREREREEKGCKMGVKRLLLVVLMEVVLVLAGHQIGNFLPGAPVNISQDDAGLQQVIVNATNLYNMQSDDAFLFRASSIIRAQRQVVKGFKYLVDFQISRTVCRKREAPVNLSTCAFQPKGLLHQTLQCHCDMWLIPWEEVAEVVLSCKS